MPTTVDYAMHAVKMKSGTQTNAPINVMPAGGEAGHRVGI